MKLSEAFEGENRKKGNAWKGVNAGYAAKHTYINRHYGNAKKCEKCNSKTAKRFDWANISGKYLREINDYIQLCRSCHRIMDKGNYCKRGHLYNSENTYIDPKKENHRQCRLCRTIMRRNYYEKNKV